jgi:uncharacterized membrane protein
MILFFIHPSPGFDAQIRLKMILYVKLSADCSVSCYNAVSKEANMTFKQMLLVYIITLVVFFVIDMIWLGLVAKGFYRRHLGDMMTPKVNWIAAMLFYLLFIVGLLVFAIRPALVAGAPTQALFYGALLGLISYATYDLTNLATLKNWPVIVTVIDLIWGTVLGGVVSYISALLSRSLLKL